MDQNVFTLQSNQVEALKHLLQCPVCKLSFRSINKPIKQCANGHPICILCFYKVWTLGCPQCRFPINGNALHLEQILKALPKACRFAELGCTKVLNGDEIKTHTETCSYGKVPCKYCKVKMSLQDELARHLREEHDKPVFEFNGFAFTRFICLHSDQKYYLGWPVLIGTPSESKDFVATMIFKGDQAAMSWTTQTLPATIFTKENKDIQDEFINEACTFHLHFNFSVSSMCVKPKDLQEHRTKPTQNRL